MKKFTSLLVFLAFMGLQTMFAQDIQITGKVTNADDGNLLPGVSVVVKGTTTGTATNINGEYSITAPSDATLTFSFVGMKSQDVAVNGQAVINVSLQTETMAVDEVVVTALGIRKEKKALGYATQDVTSDQIERTGNNDFATSLQGKVAGVDINPSSGMPGASSHIMIRGARSFTGDNTPLYVVDGMPIASTAAYTTGNSVTGSDIANRAIDINPADIASINVLKGQAAAALYGIRASNGVIIITTKSGKNNKLGKPVVSISHYSDFAKVSRNPDYQTTYAQGNYGTYVPNTSLSWGPKIVDLPDDPTNGGNSNGHPGMYYVPQLDAANLDPWVKPQVYNNWTDYFQTGYTETDNVGVTQGTEKGNFAIGLSRTDQTGIALNTDMIRWNGKANAEHQMNKNFKVGFSSNFIKSDINKLSGGNDGSLAGVLSGPSSYNLKGNPTHYPGDPYRQIYYRSLTFDNPYWVPDNNTFNEKTERFFGNGYIDFTSSLSESMNLNIRYQLGTDSYTTHYQDIFGYGSRGNDGTIDNYGVTQTAVNSLLTAHYDWNISSDLDFSLMIGNEINDQHQKYYDEYGTNFNYGGFDQISNAQTVTATEDKYWDRTVGFFGSLSLSYKSMLFLNATGRRDIVSSMPRGNRTFFYPSVSLSFVASELSALKDATWLSFAKLRASYAEVGQKGTYRKNYYTTPAYGGDWWSGTPVQYPIGGVNSYIPNTTQYDPNLKPQNTQTYELGADLKFFNNRLGIDYTFARQNVTNQIFSVPLAGSTGAGALVMNGGKVHNVSHEVILYTTPIKAGDFQWDMNFNFYKIVNRVDELAPGVESIFLGGFVTPQVRAGIGYNYPVIYGVSYVRDDAGNIVVEDNPGAWNNGMPKIGSPGVIGSASPDFILSGTSTLSYKGFSLTATVEWKNGGQMYSGSNGLLDLYGMSKRTEDRTSTFIFPGVKPDGTPNDIVRGGPSDPDAVQDLYVNVLSNIDEYYIHDNSFVKLREISLKYKYPKTIFKTMQAGVSVYGRNLLIWTALPNFDPEFSQGNNNIAGSFERFSLPQASSFGLGIDLTF
jgi:TonB-linked SusC/RagA family outer membrane protein